MASEPPLPLSGYLGPGSQWTGDLTFEGRLRVDGLFEGRIYSEGLLEVGVSGRVAGSVDVARALVAGTVEGTLKVRERLQVEPTGKVLGELTVARLTVLPGGEVSAEVTRIPPPRRRRP